MKKLISISLCSLFLSLGTAYADDVGDIIKLLEEIEASNSGIEAYSMALQQLNEDQVTRILAHYGYGDLLNDEDAQSDRKWSPDSWENALEAQSGGNSARYQQLVDEYQANHPYLSDEDMQKGASQTL